MSRQFFWRRNTVLRTKQTAGEILILGTLLLVAILLALWVATYGAGQVWLARARIDEHNAMRSWTEVPATITQAELIEHKRQRGSGRHSGRPLPPSYELVAEYEYDFAGRHYHGDCVSRLIPGTYVGFDDGVPIFGSTSFSGFHKDAYADLKPHLGGSPPFRCYVDPDRPADSVLYRDVEGELAGIAIMTTLSVLVGGLGVGMGVWAASVLLRWWRSSTMNSGGDEKAADAIVSGAVGLYWLLVSLPLAVKLPYLLDHANTDWVWLTLAGPVLGTLVVMVSMWQLRFGAIAFTARQTSRGTRPADKQRHTTR